MKESRKRSVAKTVAYRTLATALLFIVTYVYTGDTGESAAISIVFNILAAVAYYGLERLWNDVEWGKMP